MQMLGFHGGTDLFHDFEIRPARFRILPVSMKRVSLLFEVLFLFVALPPFFRLYWAPHNPLPLILISGIATLVYLRKQQGFKFRDEWLGRVRWRSQIPILALKGLIAAVVIITWLEINEPERILEFPKRAPLVWMLVMILYPILSAFPQELIFRSFFFRRYRVLFESPLSCILLSGILFGFAHILFASWISLCFSAIGGVLIAETYRRTSSLGLAALEHALYGQLVFTLGMGKYFYHGAR